MGLFWLVRKLLAAVALTVVSLIGLGIILYISWKPVWNKVKRMLRKRREYRWGAGGVVTTGTSLE
jgi:hypothetical protein